MYLESKINVNKNRFISIKEDTSITKMTIKVEIKYTNFVFLENKPLGKVKAYAESDKKDNNSLAVPPSLVRITIVTPNCDKLNYCVNRKILGGCLNPLQFR